MTLESYTERELDQLSGALLLAGGVGAAGVALLEQLRDNEELWEFTNLAPAEVTSALLSVTVQLLAALRQEIDQHGEAISSALDSLAEREPEGDADVIELGRE